MFGPEYRETGTLFGANRTSVTGQGRKGGRGGRFGDRGVLECPIVFRCPSVAGFECPPRLGDMGAPDEIKRALLGHAIAGALAHYDHSSLAIQKSHWLQKWQKKLESIIAKEGADVVEMASL